LVARLALTSAPCLLPAVGKCRRKHVESSLTVPRWNVPSIPMAGYTRAGKTAPARDRSLFHQNPKPQAASVAAPRFGIGSMGKVRRSALRGPRCYNVFSCRLRELNFCRSHVLGDSGINLIHQRTIAVERFAVLDFHRSLPNARMQSGGIGICIHGLAVQRYVCYFTSGS
jgi:hypothetical protein